MCDTELPEDLRTMPLQGKTIKDLVTSYNSNLRDILDKHAPWKIIGYVHVLHNHGSLTELRVK